MNNEYTSTDMKHMQVAVEEAYKSNVLYKRLRCSCFSKSCSKGYNKYRTFSKDGLIPETCSCHAEIDVLRKCRKQNITKKFSLYVVRLSSNDHICNSFPCKQCYETMKEFPIKNIVYSAGDGVFVKESMKDFESDYQTSGQNILEKNPDTYIKLRMKKLVYVNR